MNNYTEPNNYSFNVKNIKSEKQTHFAVTIGGETAYKEIFLSFWALGTKLCSKIVRRFRQESVLDGTKGNTF